MKDIGITKVGADLEPKTQFADGLNQTLAVTTVLTIADVGSTIDIATDAKIMTLPAVGVDTAPRGAKITFRNTGADGVALITITPASGDAVFGTIANAAADSVASGTDDESWTNTKATANNGDYTILESDGVTGWYVMGGVGIWASV